MADIEKNPLTEEETTTASGTETDGPIYTHKFPQPLKSEDKVYTELTFDFEKLRGKDVLEVTRELSNAGHAVIVKSLDDDYLIRMCARACTQTLFYGVFEDMTVRDYNKILSVAKRFF